MTMVKSSVFEEEAIKALYVVSVIIRNNLNSLKLFYSEGGNLMLQGILSNTNADVRLRRRSVPLVADLAKYQVEYSSKPEVPFFSNCALVRLLIDLIASVEFSENKNVFFNVGELREFYRFTPKAVVGDSFLPGLTGHNISKATVVGCVVWTGQHLGHFSHMIMAMQRLNPLSVGGGTELEKNSRQAS
ncbi:unnamed protein product [Lactuca virosa]|uniref:DNA-directed RNA polymerase n=1 Tax=Lactuca virosa TaxID=75947 RepID=A0AAU9LLY5_9ASTR|nr:unnamed protein product [Lactuca virosa]